MVVDPAFFILSTPKTICITYYKKARTSTQNLTPLNKYVLFRNDN